MREPPCRWSTVRRLSPRRPGDGRRLPRWRRADLVFSLVDGGLTGVMVRRRLWLWSSLAGAVAAAVAGQSRAARLAPVAAPPRLGGASGHHAAATVTGRAGEPNVIQLPRP